MNAPARLFIKTALVYLVAGLFLGSLLSLDTWLGLSPVIYPWRQAFLHILLVGWCSQFMIGLAYWKLWAKAPGKTAWLVYGGLNAGLILRLVAEPLYAFRGGELLGVLVALSGLLQLAGALIFVVTTWGQVRGSQREM
jgi:hypothetical protein